MFGHVLWAGKHHKSEFSFVQADLETLIGAQHERVSRLYFPLWEVYLENCRILFRQRW
jgi:hypothetical protein